MKATSDSAGLVKGMKNKHADAIIAGLVLLLVSASLLRADYQPTWTSVGQPSIATFEPMRLLRGEREGQPN